MTAPIPIIVNITPDPDGKRCYGCTFIGLNGSQWWCRLYSEYAGFYANEPCRTSACHAAAQEYAEMKAENERLREKGKALGEAVTFDIAHLAILVVLAAFLVSIMPTHFVCGLIDAAIAALGGE